KGFLTVDGKPDGTRLSAEDLARHWGIKVAEIYRVFQVTSRPQVGWVKLIDGHHQWQEGAEMTANRRPTDAQVTPDRRARQTIANQDVEGDAQVTPDRRPSDEGRKEGRNSTLNLTYHNITVRRGELDNPLKTEQEMPWIDSLFQTHESWSFEELQLLSQLLPIRPESKRLLIWAHNVAPDNP